MYVQADIKFIESWNLAFSKTFNWNLRNKIIVEKNLFHKKFRTIMPWHPFLFVSDYKKNSKIKSNLHDAYRNISGLICYPLKNIKLEIKSKSENYCFLHYLEIENKSQEIIFNNYKARVRTKIRSGNKKFIFKNIKFLYEFEIYKSKIKDMLIKQHLRFCSPVPPIDLLRNLLKTGAIQIIGVFNGPELKAFCVLSNDSNIAHLVWFIKSNDFLDNDISICSYHYCLKIALKRKCKIFSLGTTSSDSLGRFKEQLNAERSLISFQKLKKFKKQSQDIPYFYKRNKLYLTIMKITLRVVKFLFGERGFVYASREIWKRFE